MLDDGSVEMVEDVDRVLLRDDDIAKRKAKKREKS